LPSASNGTPCGLWKSTTNLEEVRRLRADEFEELVMAAYRLRGDTVTTVGPMVELTLLFSAAAGGSWFSTSAGASGRWTSASSAR
jgi:hypothetical protein